MEIQIGEYKLRSWKLSDYQSLANYANNWNVWINLRDSFPHPYSENDAREFISHVRTQSPETSLAIAAANEVMGVISIHLREDIARRSAEIGYWLGEPFRNQGITTLAVDAMTSWAFATFDLVRIDAMVLEWNPASARVLEKNGFVFEGRSRMRVTKDKKTIDGLVYSLIREPGD